MNYISGLLHRLKRLDFLQYEADYEAAISAVGFGRFHYWLLVITGLIYASTAISITTMSFVLPAATCDFRMRTFHKGWLSAAPMLGMVLGSYFWGCLANIKGRKVVLVSTLLLDGFVGIISSYVQKFSIFMACRFVNGFAVAGTMDICFPYLEEFQQIRYRDKILYWLEMFWTLGFISMSLLAWGIVSVRVIRYSIGSFSYDSYNWFVVACGVPSLILGFWLFSFPESPQFLMECGNYEDALACLKSIYGLNTGDDPDNYPYKSLKGNINMRQPKDLELHFSEIWTQTKALCSAPYRRYTILTSFIQFGITTSYYTLLTWLPEVYNRFEDFKWRFPNTHASVCDVSGIGEKDGRHHDPFDCYNIINPNVYKYILIVSLACIPTSLLLPLCVHTLGAKFFLMFTLGFAGVGTIGLYFVQNSIQNLVLSCILAALTSLAISLVFCLLIDLYPANLRVMAAALTLTAGRSGGLIGTLIFSCWIDFNCILPIVLFSAFLFIAGILCYYLPKTGQEEFD